MLTFKDHIQNLLHRYTHPKRDEQGKKVKIHRPSTASTNDTWHNTSSIATVTPSHKAIPTAINGVDFNTVHPDAWKTANHSSFDEPPMSSDSARKSSGVIMVEPDHRVWVMHPTNQYGGYHATFPKGGVDHGLDPKTNAVKETYEETGLIPHITAHIGDFKRTTSNSRYYLGKRVNGHPADMGWESQAVSLVPIKDLHKVVTHEVDAPVVDTIQKLYGYK